jgi:myo-inositol 2-dehydrogenase / D-chiro-inositol 1-dehydrogenase
MRFGLIGAGRIGKVHARNLARHPRASLDVVVDPDPQAARTVAAACGGQVMPDAAAAMAAPEIDAVIIATPEDTHAELVVAAAEAGKAIFCEKPLDTDPARIDACVEAVARTGAPAFVAFNRRFDPSRWALHEAIVNGDAGEVEMVHITSRDPEPTPLQFIGGIFNNMMIHDFDMARWLLGEEPVEVFAYGSALVAEEIRRMGDADTAIVIMRTPSGRLAQINNSRRAVYGYDQRVEVLGSKGMLRVENRRDTSLERYGHDATRLDVLPYFFVERYGEAFERELDHFIEAVEADRPPLISVEDARRTSRLAAAATESFRRGTPVPV